jgi:hypothetical protein
MELTEEQAKEMLVQLTKHYGQPVRPVKEYCEALSTWFRIYTEKMEGDERAHYNRLSIDLGKSDLLWRMIYNGEQLRSMKCPIHVGRWSGFSFDGCHVGCGETGWIPNDVAEQVKGKEDDELKLALLLKNEWLKVHTDEQVKEKLRYPPDHPLFGSYSKQLVERYLAERKR